jgi:hypothetical protein
LVLEEFELYLAKRRRTGKIILVCTGVLVVASIAIPYALLKAGIIRSDIFDIFVVADFLLGAAAVRAGIMRLKDKADGPIPFS